MLSDLALDCLDVTVADDVYLARATYIALELPMADPIYAVQCFEMLHTEDSQVNLFVRVSAETFGIFFSTFFFIN